MFNFIKHWQSSTVSVPFYIPTAIFESSGYFTFSSISGWYHFFNSATVVFLCFLLAFFWWLMINTLVSVEHFCHFYIFFYELSVQDISQIFYWLVCPFFTELKEFFLFCRQKPFLVYVLCMYPSSLCFVYHSLDIGFWWDVLVLRKSNL